MEIRNYIFTSSALQTVEDRVTSKMEKMRLKTVASIDTAEPTPAAVLRANQPGFTQKQIDALKQQEAQVQAREQEIQQIQSSVTELAQIFNDLARLVIEQVCTIFTYDIMTID